MVLLLGHKGYLGSYLYKNIPGLDIDKRQHKYDFIINCIGKPNLEFCESNPETSYISNYKVLEETILQYPDCKIINFSSYYVYDEQKKCTEESNVTDIYCYCKHKLLSEKITTEHNGVSFRLGKLFGGTDIQQQNKLTEYLLQTESAVLDDVMFNPTSLRQVLNVIKFELKEKTLKGVYNLSNDGTTSHFKYGLFIKEHYNKNLKIQRISKHKRMFHNYGNFEMSCEKISNLIALTSWKDDLANYLEEIR